MLLQTIKVHQLCARRNRDKLAADALTTLIGEAEAIGKNAGNRQSTDQEVIALIKKFIKNNRETYEVIKRSSGDNNQKLTELDLEHNLFSGFLPMQLSREILEIVISELAAAKPDVGLIMRGLKVRYEGQFDGALAAKLIKEQLNG